MYGYIYKITNLKNNKVYIGKHKYDELGVDPNYHGSGKLIKQAFKKYGSDNFKEEVIAYANTNKDLNNLEVWYINYYKPSYNLTKGGDGGDTISCKSQEEKDLFIKKVSKSDSDNWNYGKHYKWYNDGVKDIKVFEGEEVDKSWVEGRLPMSKTQKEKLSEARKGVNNLSNDAVIKLRNKWTGSGNPMYGVHKYGKDNSFYGKHHTKESIDKNREAHKIHYKCPYCDFESNMSWVKRHITKVHPEILCVTTIERVDNEKNIVE